MLYLRITMVYVTFSFFLLAAVDAAIGSVLVLRWTEFKAVHFADYVLTSFGCARDYQSSSDFTGSHAPGFDKVSTLNGNCDVLLSFVAFLVRGRWQERWEVTVAVILGDTASFVF